MVFEVPLRACRPLAVSGPRWFLCVGGHCYSGFRGAAAKEYGQTPRSWKSDSGHIVLGFFLRYSSGLRPVSVQLLGFYSAKNTAIRVRDFGMGELFGSGALGFRDYRL